jgi:hypothetical protein
LQALALGSVVQGPENESTIKVAAWAKVPR